MGVLTNIQKKATINQKKLIDEYFAGDDDIAKKLVIINGKVNVGKSECADILLEHLFSQGFKTEKSLNRKILFIDCYNDSVAAITYLQSLELHDYKNNLIIIDNCNEAEYSLIDILTNMNGKCSVLLIEENSEYFKKHIALQSNPHLDFDITQPIEEAKLKSYIDKHKLSTIKIKILFIIDYYFRYYNGCCWENIIQNIHLTFIEKLKAKSFIKSLTRQKVIRYFPKASNYFKFTSSFDSDYIVTELRVKHQEIYHDIAIFLHKNEKNAEVKWLSLLDLPFEIIKEYPNDDKKRHFYNAIEFGNYSKLLNELNKYTKHLNYEKEFLFEQATLNYNIGCFDKAISNFNNINNKDAIYYDGQISLLHGSNDRQIKKVVAASIEQLRKLNTNYGDYWECHILSEQGIFNIEKLREIHIKLKSAFKSEKGVLNATLFERCITDEMRWMWILQKSPDDANFANEYEERRCYLQDLHAKMFANHNNVDYYKSLYFIGGHIHYYVIPFEMWLQNGYKDNGGDVYQDSRFSTKLTEAIECYKKAIASPFDKLKSKYAAKVKLADLLAMSQDCDYLTQEKEVINFKNYAEKQGVDVFIAFANTLLAKLKILRLIRERYMVSNVSYKEIIDLLNAASSIYTKYDNKYGVNRCHYIQMIFEVLINFGNDFLYETALTALLENESIYNGIERNFINKIKSCKNCKFQDFYHSLKFYPIILQ